MIAHGGGAQLGVDLGLHGVAHLEAARFQRAVMAVHVGLDLLRVGHGKARAAGHDHALVADLAAALGVERRGVQHHHAALPGVQGTHALPVCVECYDFCTLLELLVADETVRAAVVLEHAIHPELAGRARRGLLVRHGGVEAGRVHRHAMLTAYILSQVERETISVV